MKGWFCYCYSVQYHFPASNNLWIPCPPAKCCRLCCSQRDAGVFQCSPGAWTFIQFSSWLFTTSYLGTALEFQSLKDKCYVLVFCLVGSFLFKVLFIYLFLERGEGRKTERERSIKVERDTSIGCLSPPHNWGPGLQPRHVPWLGIEPVTFQFAGQRSVHWATPARAICLFVWLPDLWVSDDQV